MKEADFSKTLVSTRLHGDTFQKTVLLICIIIQPRGLLERTHVSEEHVASIFRVDAKAGLDDSVKAGDKIALVSRWYFSRLLRP
jgi:hypothetical protein